MYGKELKIYEGYGFVELIHPLPLRASVFYGWPLWSTRSLVVSVAKENELTCNSTTVANFANEKKCKRMC